VISKPDGGWDREDSTVDTARQLGGAASKAFVIGVSGVTRARALLQMVICGATCVLSGFAGLGAGLLGGNLPMLILAWGTSLLMGWLALRHARTAFGQAPPSKARWEEEPIAASLAEPQPVRATFGAASIGAGGIGAAGIVGARESGAGTVICYDRGKLVFRAAGLGAACAMVGLAAAHRAHRNPVFDLLALIAIGFFLGWIAAMLLRATDKDLTALAWDNQRIRLRTLLSSHQVPWRDVDSVTVRKHVIRAMGVIPVWTSHYLVFKISQNGSLRKVNVPVSALNITREAIADLGRMMARRQARAAGHGGDFAGQPDFGRTVPVAQGEPELQRTGPVFGRATADGMRAPDEGDAAPAVRAAFGRKVA
jgi:hypothetical protein